MAADVGTPADERVVYSLDKRWTLQQAALIYLFTAVPVSLAVRAPVYTALAVICWGDGVVSVELDSYTDRGPRTVAAKLASGVLDQVRFS